MFAPTIAASIEAFCDHLIHCRYSPHAIRGYRARVRSFLEFANDRGLADVLSDCEAMQDELDRFIQDLKDSDKKPSYINSTLSSLKRFCAFLDLRDVQFIRELDEQATKSRCILDRDQKEALFAAMQSETKTRDRALGLLVLLGGLRASECVAMNLEDIVFNGQVAAVFVGASARRRVVAFSETLSGELSNWLRHRKDEPIIDSDAVFLTKAGRRITAVSIDMILKKIGRRARLDVSVRLLRDTYLANMLELGFEPALVAVLNGSKLDSLQRFQSQSCTRSLAAYPPDFVAAASKNG